MSGSLPARRVRRLHLRAESDDDATRAATLLTDALHTASLPADRGRLVIIRRLALGTISVHVSPGSLALHIERVTQAALAGAIAFDLPGADRADAVTFPDRGGAIVALARAHARGHEATEWYWPSVLPGWHACTSREERWLLLLEAAHRLPESAVVAAAAVEQAVTAGVEDHVLSSMRPWQAERWLQLEGWAGADPEPSFGRFWTGGREPACADLPPRRAAIVSRWQQRWEPADVRLVWLGTMWAVHDCPARAADSRLPGKVAATLVRTFEARRARLQPVHPGTNPRIAQVAGPGTHPRREPLPKPADQSLSTDLPPPCSLDSTIHEPSNVRDCRETAGTVDAVARSSTAIRDAQPEIEHEPEAVRKDAVSGISTRYAGLLFVVPVLDRLGFAPFLADHPSLLEIDVPLHLLSFIGRSVGVQDDDPIAALFQAPSGRFERTVAAWTLAVRRWCRRHARMSVATLVRRPGRVHASRTHIESCFTLSQLDVRLRRVALDVDPGWVPWLGRVVRFHYLDQHDKSD